MTKVNPNKLIQKRRTEAEMRTALHCKNMPSAPDDIDSPGVVLRDVIEELLEARAIIEEFRGFVQSTYQKMNRR